MPFVDTPKIFTPLGLPEGFDINPDAPDVDTSASNVIGSAFRLGNFAVSMFSSFQYDRSKPFDPDYYPSNDIQGTIYENYSDRFVGAPDAEDVAMMKSQIDRELEDRSVVHAAGVWGFMAEMGAALF